MNGSDALPLTALRNLLDDPTFSSFIKSFENEKDFYVFVGNLYKTRSERNFTGWLQDLILYDENAFSLCCAAGETPSEYLKAAFIRDLKIIFDLAAKAETKDMFAKGECSYPFDRDFNHAETCKNLSDFYSRKGYGIFIKNSAFIFKDGKLLPVENPPKTTLVMLKNYEREKNAVKSNIVNFLKDLPYSDMLIYGDRGTGKSSTVHAMLNEYSSEGLRLIEINKEQISLLSEVKRLVSALPLKFIIFIDDLSLGEYDKEVSSLKAGIEGSVGCGGKNTMLVATSNRRHIVKETYTDRQNSVHVSDSVEETLSLSDRFGITVMFSSTDKKQYLSIVKQLADDMRLNMGEAELFSTAERWAIVKGGRSPRRAKQIVDMLYSASREGGTIDF